MSSSSYTYISRQFMVPIISTYDTNISNFWYQHFQLLLITFPNFGTNNISCTNLWYQFIVSILANLQIESFHLDIVYRCPNMDICFLDLTQLTLVSLHHVVKYFLVFCNNFQTINFCLVFVHMKSGLKNPRHGFSS